MQDLSGLYFLVGLFSLILAIAILFAIFRLFSIDSTLKQILVELRGGPDEAAKTEEREKARAVLARYGRQLS